VEAKAGGGESGRGGGEALESDGCHSGPASRHRTRYGNAPATRNPWSLPSARKREIHGKLPSVEGFKSRFRPTAVPLALLGGFQLFKDACRGTQLDANGLDLRWHSRFHGSLLPWPARQILESLLHSRKLDNIMMNYSGSPTFAVEF
jgi:hypothetical protein